MFAKTYSAQTVLLKGKIIDVEVDLSRGLYNFTVVGLPDKAVEESRDRVSAAIKNSGFTSPKNNNQKVVVSLAPADLKKEGPVFDLSVSLSYLLASNQIFFDPKDKLFLGELSLDGALRPISGALPLVLSAKEAGFEEVYLPIQNIKEASLVGGIDLFPLSNLSEAVGHLTGKNKIDPYKRDEGEEDGDECLLDFSEIKGQALAKRGLLIAAAGGHNVAMFGPPGTGKSMLAKAFPNLLPNLSFEDMLEVTSIHSIAGVLHTQVLKNPPFRSPHHTSSYVSMVGGGAYPKPGEITLAHKGILFLDEFPEFERRVIDALRQPLEEKHINISRAKGSAVFPADFILVAALNPCPCGNYGSEKPCSCSALAAQKYQRKISGPISDRIDIWVEVSKVDYVALGEKIGNAESPIMKELVKKARQKQISRGGTLNSHLSSKTLIASCEISTEAKDILDTSAVKVGLTGRGYHKAIKVARTIADIEDSFMIEPRHILESLQYRLRENHIT